MNRPTLIVSLLIVAGTLILMGTTYAYFTATATSNEQVTTSGTLELTYETGQDIHLESAYPTTEDEAGVHQFKIRNTGTLDTEYNLYLSNISLTKNGMDTTSSDIKYTLYESNDDYSAQKLVQSGSFGAHDGYFAGDKNLLLLENIPLSSGEEQNYILKVWLQETGVLQNEEQGMDLNFRVMTSTKNQIINRKVAVYGLGDFIAYYGHLNEASQVMTNYTSLMEKALWKSGRSNGSYAEGGEYTVKQFLEGIKTGTIASHGSVNYRNALSSLGSEDIVTFSIGLQDIYTDYLEIINSGINDKDEIVKQLIQRLDNFIQVYDELLNEVSMIYDGHIILLGSPSFLGPLFQMDEEVNYYWNKVFEVYDEKMRTLAINHQVDYISGYYLFKGRESQCLQEVEGAGISLTLEAVIELKNALMDKVLTYMIESPVLLTIGDSIGRGTLASGTISSYQNGYNEMIYNELYFQNSRTEVIYSSIGGTTIGNYIEAIKTGKMTIGDQVLDYPLRDVLSTLSNNDILTLSITGNDIIQEFIFSNFIDEWLFNQAKTLEEAKKIMDGIIANYEEFLREVRVSYSGHFIMLGCYNVIVPCYSLADDTNPLLVPWLELMSYYDEKMEEVSEKYNVDYISGYQLFKGKERVYFPTGGDVHPNEAGYELIADQMLEIIKNYG